MPKKICVSCGQNVGMLSNYGSDVSPLCFDCNEKKSTNNSSVQKPAAQSNNKNAKNDEDSLVVLKEYTYRHEAEIAKGMLEMDGIASVVQSDDCGGLDSSINFGTAARLLVKKKDLKQASVSITKN